MDKPKLVIWGASGHSRVVAEIVCLEGKYDLVGFLDDVKPDRTGTLFAGRPILGGRDPLAALRESGAHHLIIAIGSCVVRLKLSRMVESRGLSLATAIHPRATVSPDTVIGPGTVIAAGSVVNPGTRVGTGVIINTGASIDHDCVIGDGAHVSPGACLAGRVRVGEASWIGAGATIIDRVSVGAGSIIGAGAVVLHDVPDGVVAYGVPAKVVRNVEEPA